MNQASILLLGFGLVFLAIIWWQFAVRCPFCRNLLAPVIYSALSPWWKFNRRVKFCPYCGRSFEDSATE